MENDVTSIVLSDEDGNKVEFEVVTKMDIEDKEYVVVVPKDADEENTEEAIVLRIDKDEDDNDILITVEDDDEFAIVSEAYETLFSEDELD